MDNDTGRTRSIPEIRGFAPALNKNGTRRTNKYSIKSYVAQYGVTWAEAEDAHISSETHLDVEQKLSTVLASDKTRLNDVLHGKERRWNRPASKPVKNLAPIGGMETPNSILERMALFVIGPPSPIGVLKENMSVVEAQSTARELIGSNTLQKWLDECIQEGNHELDRDDKFTWDGIPESARENIEWNLAMRYLEYVAESEWRTD